MPAVGLSVKGCWSAVSAGGVVADAVLEAGAGVEELVVVELVSDDEAVVLVRLSVVEEDSCVVV